MRRRDVWIVTGLLLCTIFAVMRMVPAHAEDSTDETGYPTPTETVFIETPYPTMTEMTVPENPDDTPPTETPTPYPTATETTVVYPTDVPVESTPLPTDTPMPEPTIAAPQPTDGPLVAMTTTLNLSSAGADPALPFVCPVDTTVMVRGSTKPLTMLLLRFDQRIVGGGISDESGGYAIPLVMGHEASGTHQIQVIARQTGRHIQQVSCDTP